MTFIHSALARFIKTGIKVQIYTFDEPFHRSISVVYGSVYIGEAHLVQNVNVIENQRYLVEQHLKEQQAHIRIYSKHIEEIRNLVLQTNISQKGKNIPAIDNVAYGQVVDHERDSEAIDDPRIPVELMEAAINYKTKTQDEDLSRSILRSFADLD